MRKNEALRAVLAEPELPGPIPKRLRAEISGAVRADDWEHVTEILRTIVRVTKARIHKRIDEISNDHSA